MHCLSYFRNINVMMEHLVSEVQSLKENIPYNSSSVKGGPMVVISGEVNPYLKLELASKHFVASTANLVSVTTKATTIVSTITRTESKDETINNTHNPTTIDRDTTTCKTSTKVVTKTPMIENDIATKTESPISMLPSMHPYLTYKSPKLQQETSIVYPPTLHKSYDIARFIEAKLATKQVGFSYSNHFSSLKPPKFVFLQTQPKPPWERHNPRYKTMILEDKDRFQAWSIVMCLYVDLLFQITCIN
ncbi:hypothetical protein Tco_1103799 [Tanacetum coccineum]